MERISNSCCHDPTSCLRRIRYDTCLVAFWGLPLSCFCSFQELYDTLLAQLGVSKSSSGPHCGEKSHVVELQRICFPTRAPVFAYSCLLADRVRAVPHDHDIACVLVGNIRGRCCALWDRCLACPSCQHQWWLHTRTAQRGKSSRTKNMSAVV